MIPPTFHVVGRLIKVHTGVELRCDWPSASRTLRSCSSSSDSRAVLVRPRNEESVPGSPTRSLTFVTMSDPASLMALATKLHEENLRRKRRTILTRTRTAVQQCYDRVKVGRTRVHTSEDGVRTPPCVFRSRSLVVDWWNSFLLVGVIYSTAYSPLVIVQCPASEPVPRCPTALQSAAACSYCKREPPAPPRSSLRRDGPIMAQSTCCSTSSSASTCSFGFARPFATMGTT